MHFGLQARQNDTISIMLQQQSLIFPSWPGKMARWSAHRHTQILTKLIVSKNAANGDDGKTSGAAKCGAGALQLFVSALAGVR